MLFELMKSALQRLTNNDEIREDPPDGHSDWFPVKMGEIMKRTNTWCDVMSLSPPDGKFLEELRDAITHINRNADPENPPVIRMMFGNIIGKQSVL
jgi:hypothetical protein